MNEKKLEYYKRKIFLYAFCFLIGIFSPLYAVSDTLNFKQFNKDFLLKVITDNTEWVKYPRYRDRCKWDSIISNDIKQSIIKEGEKALKHVWKPNLASQYLAYKNKGQILTGRDNYLAIQALMLAELVEGRGRFLESLIDGVWFMCETTWLHSAHLVFQKDQSGLPDPEEPTVELVVADIGAEMAWAYFFFKDEFDKISPLISKEIRKAVYKKMIDPYFSRDDYWWMGFTGRKVNNWNIWINYNLLQAVSLLEEDKEKRSGYIARILQSAEFFLNAYQDDGACEEGPTYWGHAGANLYKFADLLFKLTEGRINLFKEEKVQNIGKYIYRVNIIDNNFVNFSDASPIVNIKPGLVYSYGEAINDKFMMDFACRYLEKYPHDSFIGGCFATALDEVFTVSQLSKQNISGENYILSHCFQDTELVVARDSKTGNKGFFFAALGGNNGQSHNHNDVGSCILYYNGSPVLIDVGVGTYTKKTFSSQRYSIWTMQSCFHNLPTINGYNQKNGLEYSASDINYNDSRTRVLYSMDIGKAYPVEAGIKKWKREYILSRNKQFSISDNWKLGYVKDEIIFNFITSCDVWLGNEKIIFKGNDFDLQMTYDSDKLEVTYEKITFYDKKLKSSWSKGYVYKIMFRTKKMLEEDKNVFIIKNLK